MSKSYVPDELPLVLVSVKRVGAGRGQDVRARVVPLGRCIEKMVLLLGSVNVARMIG